MWEKINNSSLLFSKTFIENRNHHSIYSNRVFFNRIYFYYVNKGYYRIIINSIVNLLVSNFLVFFILFLFNCIDYRGLLELTIETSISSYIDSGNILNLNIFFMSLLILFFVLDIIKVISLLDDIYVFSNIKKFYNNNLKIRDSELEYLEWKEILNIYVDSTNMELNPYYIDSIITAKDNYFIALLDNKILRPYHLNSIFEWNLMYCIIYSFVDNSEKISDLVFKNPKKIEDSMKHRLRTISILSVIFMPLIMVIITFYNLFNYGEQFYNKPNLFISKNFTRLAKLKFRNYNELSHMFEERMDELTELTRRYNDTFKNKILEAGLKLVIFVFSSIFMTLIILTILNDHILTNLNILGGKNVLWFIGVFGSIIAILRTIINTKSKENPINIMEKIADVTIVDNNIIQNANMSVIKNKFLENYKFKILQIFYDILWTMIMPIQLWSISYDSRYIINFIKKISSNNTKIGISCVFSDFCFDNNRDEETYFGSLLDASEKEDFIKKKNHSIEMFEKMYPNCLENIVTESTQINVI
jgi:autophagy-related protein 9